MKKATKSPSLLSIPLREPDSDRNRCLQLMYSGDGLIIGPSPEALEPGDKSETKAAVFSWLHIFIRVWFPQPFQLFVIVMASLQHFSCVETLPGPLCATFATPPVSYGLFIQVENAVEAQFENLPQGVPMLAPRG